MRGRAQADSSSAHPVQFEAGHDCPSWAIGIWLTLTSFENLDGAFDRIIDRSMDSSTVVPLANKGDVTALFALGIFIY
jgi:hypothetical protein